MDGTNKLGCYFIVGLKDDKRTNLLITRDAHGAKPLYQLAVSLNAIK